MGLSIKPSKKEDEKRQERLQFQLHLLKHTLSTVNECREGIWLNLSLHNCHNGDKAAKTSRREGPGSGENRRGV